MEGSTINPSDTFNFSGAYGGQIPRTAGVEGSGRVIKAEGEEVQHWVGKRVCFINRGSGTWGNYCATVPALAFEIDDDVSLQSASSGVVNPLTAIGMI